MNGLVWFRRDLRLDDHHALHAATKECTSVFCVFVLDENILSKLPRDDRRISFIRESLLEINEGLKKNKSQLFLLEGKPEEEIINFCQRFQIQKVFFNRDYEPYAKNRDEIVQKKLKSLNIQSIHFKDHVIFEKTEVLKDNGEIYKVFTPYKNKWLEKFETLENQTPKFKTNFDKMVQKNDAKYDLLNSKIFKSFELPNNNIKGGRSEALKLLKSFKNNIADYKEARDFPILEKTSGLSPYLRMGCLSIREALELSLEQKTLGHQTWLSELIWREFYQMILDVFPKVENHSFKIEYDKIKWPKENEKFFESWCNGQTGFPIVDAAMRCLNQTGNMHNRLRMIVASFLVKTLLVDWKKGEKYFALKLIDFDLAANNGGWQWSASTGVDAQPYFRIFNPFTQSEKFDSNGDFIRMWCPELRNFDSKWIHYPHDSDLVVQAQAGCLIGTDYPHPIVSYKENREKAILLFKNLK